MKPDASPPNAIEEAIARARLRQMRAKHSRPAPPGIGLAARKATHKALKGTGSPLSKLRSQWPAIVGDKLAAVCRPEKITGAKGNRTLVLRVLPAAAPLVQHQSEVLRQRISVAAGGDVTKIKLLQGSLPRPALPAPHRARALTSQENDWLNAETARIDNPKLRNALMRLGKALITDPSFSEVPGKTNTDKTD